MASPGRSYREGITLLELAERFPDEASALKWFEKVHWPDGKLCCLRCGSENVSRCKHKTMPFRCRDCKKYFSVKTGTAMESSNLPLRKWVWAIYLENTGLKGVSSMKLHRDIGTTQSCTWHMLRRIRAGLMPEMIQAFEGPVEVDESYLGGLEKIKHEHKKLNAGRGTVGKSTILGAKDRKTNKISAKVIEDTTKPTVQEFSNDTRSENAEVFTDEHKSYKGLTNHTSVNHSRKQWAVSTALGELAHTNGIESFWAVLKRAYHGPYHHLSKKHLNRYVTQFAGKHNLRDYYTIDQMAMVVRGMVGKRLKYKDLIK